MQRAWFAVKMHALTALAIVVALAGVLLVQSIADGWISKKRS